MKKTSKILALLLALVMVFSLSALADMEPPEGDKKDDGMPENGTDTSMALNENASLGGTIFNVTEEGLTQALTEGFELTGEVGQTEADGIELVINSFTTNGFKVTGGEYTIRNSVITGNVTGEVDANDGGGYCAGVTGGVLTIDNCIFTTNGKGGRNGNYTIDCEGSGVLVVINSEIIQTGAAGDPEGYTSAITDPPSNEALTISGYARANMSVGKSSTYYYGSYVETEGWAAMSTDSAQSGFNFYSYDSVGKALYGGYGTYADTSCVDWFYGSVLSSAEVGAIISNNGEIHLFGGDAATADGALAYLPADYENTEDYIAREGRSLVEAGRNCVQLHSPDMGGAGAKSDYFAILEAEDTDFVTSAELDAQATLVDWYEDYGPALGEYVDLVKGAIFLVKSTGSKINLTACTAESSSGVLLMTAPNSDSMSRYAKADNDMAGKGSYLTLTDCDITGDVKAYDYQRNAVVSLESSTWTGAVETWDKETWDAFFSEECKADSKCYWILDTSVYHDGTGNGSTVNVDAGSVWNAVGESNLVALTVEAGGVINGTVTVDGAEVDVAAGGSWTGDIRVVGEAAAEAAPAAEQKDEGAPAAEASFSDGTESGGAQAGNFADLSVNEVIPTADAPETYSADEAGWKQYMLDCAYYAMGTSDSDNKLGSTYYDILNNNMTDMFVNMWGVDSKDAFIAAGGNPSVAPWSLAEGLGTPDSVPG